jgi:hypothetical protein
MTKPLDRFARLLQPGPFDALPPRQAQILEAFRIEVARGGLERGVITRAGNACGMKNTNAYKWLSEILARAERHDALIGRRVAKEKAVNARGYHSLPGMQVTRVTDQTDENGEIASSSYRQEPEPADTLATPGAALPGFVFKRVSSMVSGGEVRQEWQIQEPEKVAQVRALQEWVAGLAEPLAGLSPLVATPRRLDADLLAYYPMGDPHFGLYAWAEEAGEDFDLTEAERVTCGAIDRLVAMAPPAETATLLNLGDFFHADGHKAATPNSGNQLDVDTRFPKVMEAGARAMRWCVLRMLEKHKHVRVRNVPGNHDPTLAVALGLILKAHFENNKRVTVDTSAALFTFQRFGANLIGECHGDTAKAEALPGVMMNDARAHISETQHWYFHKGHVHHDSVKEHSRVKVETHRTLAAKDAWHAGQGYRSGRSMKIITYHREHGEVHRSTCDVGMLAA